jgi:tetratricopeptide (TPR) repeat protein
VAHVRAGNVHQTEGALREAINNAPNFTEATLLLAELNIQTGAVGPAIDDLETLIKSQPGVMGAHALLSAAYLNQRDPARALATARKQASVAPQDARGPYLAGAALLAQGKRAEARRELGAALVLAPGFLDPLVRLTSLELAESQPQAAIERVRQQTALAPASGAHQALLGNLYLLRSEPMLAEAAFLPFTQRTSAG